MPWSAFSNQRDSSTTFGPAAYCCVQVSPPSSVFRISPPCPAAQPCVGSTKATAVIMLRVATAPGLPPGRARIVGKQDDAVIADRDQPRPDAREREQRRLGRERPFERGSCGAGAGVAGVCAERDRGHTRRTMHSPTAAARARLIPRLRRERPDRANACTRAASRSASSTFNSLPRRSSSDFLESCEPPVGVDNFPQQPEDLRALVRRVAVADGRPRRSSPRATRRAGFAPSRSIVPATAASSPKRSRTIRSMAASSAGAGSTGRSAQPRSGAPRPRHRGARTARRPCRRSPAASGRTGPSAWSARVVLSDSATARAPGGGAGSARRSSPPARAASSSP